MRREANASYMKLKDLTTPREAGNPQMQQGVVECEVCQIIAITPKLG